MRVVFAGHETKGGRPLEFDWPRNCAERSNSISAAMHPMLYDRCPNSDAPLWPSLQRRKRQMGECGIYMRITKVTMKHLGRHINPHMFRDAAATFIAEMTPDRALLAAGVLQHRTFANDQGSLYPRAATPDAAPVSRRNRRHDCRS